jgi:hypothetical protein
MSAALFRFAPWLALIGVAWAGGCQYAENRALAGQVGRLEDVRDSLAAVARGRDTVYRADTVRLTRTRTVTDSVLRVDTLVHRDTVVRLVERERAACDAVIATCEARVADRDRQIVNLDSLLRLEKRRGGSPWKTKLGWLLAGAAAGVLIPR